MHNLPILEAKTALGRGADTDIIPVYQDASKKAVPPKGPYGQTVARLRKLDAFAARNGSVQYLRFGGKGGVANALLAGLGTPGELTEEKARNAGGHAWLKLVAEKAKAIAVRADLLIGAKGAKADDLALVRAFAEGLILGAYRFEKHKGKGTDKRDANFPARITFVTKDKNLQKELARVLGEVRAAAEAMNVTRDWSNEPSNHGTPEYFASEAKRLAKEYGLKCTVLTEKDAEKEGMGLFLAVGQGSEREGRIVVLEYTPPKSENMRTIAFVGKGITFDSGGISIKPSMRMEEMKHDMTGAATLMGATLLAAKMKVPNRIVTIMGFTENMPDGTAVQPGNVVTSRAGKTVEIINTDAEGRLILGDLLDYAHEFKPDVIVNAATLTGAIGVALGKYCCGIFGNDDELIETIRSLGESNGERVWQLPLFDEYFDDMRSETADFKNSVNDAHGGAIRGAIFLKQFIRKGVRWAHMDIASTASGISHLSYIPKKQATGLHVRTLAQFARNFS